MQIPKKSILFLLFLYLLTSTKCTNTNTNTKMIDYCLAQVCSNDNPITQYVQFPFLIRNDSFPKSCGYPGFDLFCDGGDRLLVDLPISGIFSVQSIDYGKQELWLNDPNNCLPKRLLSLNFSIFSNSPFTPIQEQVYWLYNCSSDYFKFFTYTKPIGCLSGSSYGVIAIPSEIIGNDYSLICDRIGSIRVPSGSGFEAMNFSDLNSGIRLTWVEPNCGDCFQSGGQCGFANNSSLEVGCFNVPRRRLLKNAVVAVAIALAFAAPLALFGFFISYFIIKAVCERRRRRRNDAVIGLAQIVTEQTQPVISGLDPSIIESYPKVVLGDSRRLPKPDDKHCPICLGEYVPKDTLRTLPQCEHCFHADCIDAWLHMNATCPVCRNSPSNNPMENT